MKATCYGSRGSLPSPSKSGFSTLEFGGNTSCIFVEAGPFMVILDNGSGMRSLGDDLMKRLVVPAMMANRRVPFINLITHYHWDHIQGTPFCTPFFMGNCTFYIHGMRPSGHETPKLPRTAVEEMLAHQQSNPHFPVAHESMPSRKVYMGHNRQFSERIQYAFDPMSGEYDIFENGEYPEAVAPENILSVTTIPLNHPDGGLGYRLDYLGRSLAYCTDNEPLRHPNAKITKLAQGVDHLILDGQYTEDQLSGPTQVFGHGTPRSCVEQAISCKAKNLVVFHHDPSHDDQRLGEMEVDAQKYAVEKGYAGTVCLAREGSEWITPLGERWNSVPAL